MNPFADLPDVQKNKPASVASSNPFADLPSVGIPKKQEKKQSKVGAMVKSLVSAPATIAARPVQAIQATGQMIEDAPKLSQFKTSSEDITQENDALMRQYRAIKAAGGDTTAIAQKIRDNNARLVSETRDVTPLFNRRAFSGGVIAETPENFKDVKKDVGRAIQTVALGTSAPLVGGAAFGVGSSLEQGNDLLSVQTLVNTALGAGGGKVADWIGKPLLNAAGKVVGVITPQILKDTAAKGANALQQFAQNNKLLGGVASDLSENIAKGATKAEEGVGTLFKSGKSGVKETLSKQYPAFSKNNIQKYYTEINEKDIVRPITENAPAYRNATKVYTNAKNRGIDLEKVGTERGIRHDRLHDGKNYNTQDTVDALRGENYELSNTVGREALKAAEPGVQRIPVQTVRERLLKQIDDFPASQYDEVEKEFMRKQVLQRYGDNSSTIKKYANGYSLTDLHDNRILSAKRGKYNPKGEPIDNLNAELRREEGRIFAEILDQNIPEGLPIKDFRRELEKTFMLADYLESLHLKKVPEGVTKKAVRLFGRAAAATVGGKVGGFPGSILGSQYGDMLFSTFQTLPNPVKNKVLASIKVQDPKAFKALQEYTKNQGIQQATRLRLPEGGTSSFKPTGSTLFSTPEGRITPVLQEAVDAAARETGKIKTPKASLKGAKARMKLKEILENSVENISENNLPVIDIGKLPKAPSGAIDVSKLTAPQIRSLEILLKNMEPYIPENKLPSIQF